jgi:hypothetical protein
LDLLGAGNSLVRKWSSFLKEKVGKKIEESGLFPIKIDIPLNYSLFFGIEFTSFKILKDS